MQLLDITDAAGLISLTLPANPSPVTLTGTFSSASGMLQLQAPGCTPTDCFGLSAWLPPDANDMMGFFASVSLPFPGYDGLTASRCECDDGNTTDGDGCDAECRIEPCFTCSGMPSTCVPSGDGAACEDGSPCTTGETCTGGVCGGGTAVPGCLDLNGSWTATTQVTGFEPEVAMVTLRHRGTTLRIRQTTGIDIVAAFTPDTRALFSRLPDVNPLCPGFEDFSGTVAPTGNAYDYSGVTQVPTPHFCVPFGVLTTAVRGVCGNGVLEGAEACDDGNLVNGDGCDANCTITACGNGIQTAGEACDDGNLAGGDGCSAACTIEACFVCESVGPNEPNSCRAAVGPCATPTVGHAAALTLRNAADPHKDTIQHTLKKGSALAPVMLGEPRATTDYQVCLFDASQPTLRLLFSAQIPHGGSCGSKACWSQVSNGFRYRNAAATPDGIRSLILRGGSAGQSSVTLKGAGALLSGRPGALPAVPLPVPLELVVGRSDGSACFLTNFPAAYVGENDPVTGRFRAKAGQ